MDLGSLAELAVVVHIRKAGSKHCGWAVARAAVYYSPVERTLVGHKTAVVDHRHPVDLVVAVILEEV